jgi:hypothetical protein
MRRTLLAGLLLAVLVVLLAAAGDLLSLAVTWPVLLGAAVALVPGTGIAGRIGALLVGALAGWIAYALRAAVLPDLGVSVGISLAIAVLVVTAAAVASVERLPLWAGLTGVAAFAGLYDAAYRASPTDFLAQSTVALTTLLLAVALGAAGGMLAGAGARRARAFATTDTADLAKETS